MESTPNNLVLRDPAVDRDWQDLSCQWRVRPDTIYLNHGSFGLAPDPVRYARRGFINQLDENPMDFLVRELEGLLLRARSSLANFVGTEAENLVFVDNATYGMNVVANSFPLHPGDEVLLNDHEYGAVHRIWQRRCDEVGASCRIASLPSRFEDPQAVVDALQSESNEKTKLVVVSHITSPTALILPVEQICSTFSEQGIAVCIDGPHAPAQVEIDLNKIDCDFYTASCHKWLCATLGSGFLFVHPRWQNRVQPIMKSWGRLLPAIPERWDEEFMWLGTRDPSCFLSVPIAIEFMESIGLDSFRQRSRWLAAYAESALTELFGTTPLGERSRGWYGSMAHVPLSSGDWSHLQASLWEQVGIEIPIIQFNDGWFVRVSCHLYNNTTQIDTLVKALSRLCNRV